MKTLTIQFAEDLMTANSDRDHMALLLSFSEQGTLVIVKTEIFFYGDFVDAFQTLGFLSAAGETVHFTA